MKGSIGGSMRIKYSKHKTSKAIIDINGKEGDICPSCRKGILKLRKSKFGNFLGCELFPKCKGIVKWH